MVVSFFVFDYALEVVKETCNKEFYGIGRTLYSYSFFVKSYTVSEDNPYIGILCIDFEVTAYSGVDYT